MSNQFDEEEDNVLVKQEFDLLRQKVLESINLSYSPYSKFRVGCAILTSEGVVYKGANIENASYGGSICAERTTICSAVLKGHKNFKAIAIISDLEDEFITPCGICRQFIREFSKDVPVYMFKKNADSYLKKTLSELLPLSFGPEQLQ